MVATNTQSTLRALRTKLQAMGGVAGVVIGEPKSAMQSGLVAVLSETGRIDETVLDAPREVHEVTLRRFENAMEGPEEDVEFLLDRWRAELLQDLWGDFDLGATVAHLLPALMSWAYGYVTIENVVYRYLDITVVFRVDPVATFTQ